MTKLRFYVTIPCLLLGVVIFASTSLAQTRPAIVEQLAKTYGLDSYGQIEAVRYTFNLDLPALKVNLARTWTWEPKTGAVIYESKDKDGKPVKVSYNRNQMNSAPANVKDDVDPGFVNDNYWFIFPFHLYWDTSAAVTVTEKQKLPIGKGTATLVSVKYPAELGGYTPGDTCSSSICAEGRRNPATSPRPGRVTRRPARCSSPPTIAERRTRSRRAFSLRMWPTSWRVRTSGWTLLLRNDVAQLYESRRLASHHNGGAGTAEFGEIAICGHANVEPQALSPNDRAIKIRLEQGCLKASPSGASSMTCVSKLAGATGFWESTGLLKRRRVQNF